MFDIDYLLLLQDLRHSVGTWLTPLMLGISDFFYNIGPLMVAAIVFWCVDKRVGYLLFFNLYGAGMVNQAVKNTLCVYRPWMRNPAIVPPPEALPTATGYSFPSGHTQTATSFFGTFAWRWRRWWVVALCAVGILLVAFSRNYLGVHTPQDVAVAIAEALLVLWLSTAVLRWYDRRPRSVCFQVSGHHLAISKDIIFLIAALFVIAAFMFFCLFKNYPYDVVDGKVVADPAKMRLHCCYYGGAAVGMVTGWFVEHRWIKMTAAIPVSRRLLRGIVGVLLLMAVHRGLTPLCVQWLGDGWGYFAQQLAELWTITIAVPAVPLLTRKVR